MNNIQRKYVTMTSPLVLSLCCLSPLTLTSLSFQDLLERSSNSSLFRLGVDTALVNNLLMAQMENCSISWPTSSWAFPILSESGLGLQTELFLLNTPVYPSYLECVFVEDNKYKHALLSSFPPQLFYAQLPSLSPPFAIETALKAPPEFIHPVEESVACDDMLSHNATYPTNFASIDSQTTLSASSIQYAPVTQTAPPLSLDKHTLANPQLLSLQKDALQESTAITLPDPSFMTQAATPSAEVSLPTRVTLPLSYEHPVLTDFPLLLDELKILDAPTSVGNLVPAENLSSFDLLPLSHTCSHPPLPHLLLACPLEQEQNTYAAAAAPIKETRDIPFTLSSTLLTTQKDTDNTALWFAAHESSILCQEIHLPPLLEQPLLPKTSSLKPIAPDVLPSLSVPETGPKYAVSPSFEPWIQWPFHLSPFVPDSSFLYIGPLISFETPAYADLTARYLNTLTFPKENAFIHPDPYASDALISYVTTHTSTPTPAYTPVAAAPLLMLSPKAHTLMASYPISLSTSAFDPLVNFSSESPITLQLSNTYQFYPLYVPHQPFSQETSAHLLQDRILGRCLLDTLNPITPSLSSTEEEHMLLASLLPEKELSPFAKDTDYPFLQDFYVQAPMANITPFLFSHAWNALPFSSAIVLFQEKSIPSTTFALTGATTLLESIGAAQALTSSVHIPVQTPSLLSPFHESYPLIAWSSLLGTPDPSGLALSSYPLPCSLGFAAVPFSGAADYVYSISCDILKHSLPVADSLLSPSLESLHHSYDYSITTHHDIPEASSLVPPNAEDSHALAYSSLSTPSLNHYSVRIEKNSTLPSNIPRLLADAALSPDLVSVHIDLCPSRKNAAVLNQSSRSTQENLASLPTLQDLRTLSLSEDFIIDVQVTQNTKGSGYLFAITLEPTVKKMSSGAPQNFIFLIDRSSSIDKNRLQIFKQAIHKSLLYLKEEDTFNILSFDTEISKMSYESVPVSPSTKHGARRFLEAQKRGYKYALPNLYKVLLNVHAMVQDSALPTTVVLLTNGKSLENFNTQDEQLARLVSANRRGFTLFTACASHNNNTLMLEILSTLNHGECMHSQTNAAFPRKLAAFVKHAGHLIAEDIHISAAKADPDLEIEFFPNTASAPNLYGDRPYTIIGKVDKLCDFDLVLQGRVCDQWLNVTKKVSLATAKHGRHAIYKDYTLHMAYNKYREFLQEGNTACLDEAKKVLQPFNTGLSD